MPRAFLVRKHRVHQVAPKPKDEEEIDVVSLHSDEHEPPSPPLSPRPGEDAEPMKELRASPSSREGSPPRLDDLPARDQALELAHQQQRHLELARRLPVISSTPSTPPISPGMIIIARIMPLYLDSPKNESYHDTNFIVIGDTAGCLYDNLWCHRWRQSPHHDNSQPRCHFQKVEVGGLYYQNW